MKRQILAFLMLCLGLTAMAQQITKYEYWLDTSHAERTIHPAETGSLEFTIDVGNLCHGLHALNFRAQDSEGRWSSPSSSYFYCIDKESTSQGVSQYEYWLDQNVAERVAANSQGSTIGLDVDISTLLTGLHTFTFRYKDDMGHWSAPQTSYFLVPIRQKGSDIQNTYEYWIDNKQGEKVQVKGYNGVIDLSLDVNTLPTGLHSLSFRATDQNGVWSAPQTSYFLVPIRQKGSDIQNTYEYWLDNRQNEKVQVKGYNGVIDLSLDVKTLPTGLHSLSFRATDQNGIWSAPQTSYFLVPIRQNGSNIQNTYEYWLDNKQGEKVQVKGYNGVIDLSLDVNALPTGLHSLSFRATDQNGIWSAPQTSYFYIPVDMNVNQNIKAYCYWFNDAFENRITETVSPAVIPFTLDAKLMASDVVTDITPENITMADDGEGHVRLATKNILHTQFCTEDGRWTGFSVDTFAVVINVPEVDLTSFIKNPDASSKWNGWTTEGSTTGILNTQTWQDGGNYFRLGNTSKNEWNSSMQQTITGLPAGTYILSAKGRAAEGVEMELSVNGFADTFPAAGTAGGELTNGWTERSLIFTTDGQPFVIKVSGSANSSGKWMDIADFGLIYSNVSNASLMVNMPETADMAIYKNLKLWLTSVSSKLSVTTSNAHNYNFQGLTAGVAYNLMLTNRYGQTIAQKDSIMIAEGENSITLSNLMQLCNVEAAVTDIENNNLTDKVRIAWFMHDGTPVSDDSSIKGLASGTKLLCNVSLGDSLGCIYREVKEQEYLLTKGDNKFTISLAPIEKASIIGKVLAEDGNTNLYATISVTEWLNGRYGKTLSVRTDSKGTFALDCHQDSLHVTIVSDGYLDCVVDTVCASSAIDLGALYLKEITGIVITPRLNYRNATEEGETEDTIFYSNADNVDYFVTNLSTGSAVNDIKVQSGTIIAKSGVNVGDKLSVRIHSRKDDFEDVTAETIVAEDETAEIVFNIVEKGSLKASYEFSGNNEDIAMLYNADGALVSREFYSGNSCTFSHLSDGHYTLLSMGKMLMMDAILNLSDLSAIGLTEGTDYVLSNVEIKAGKITIINNENIPQIDETLFYYTGTNTSFSANKSSVVVGNYITLTGRLDFKEEYADDVDDLSLVVDLPEGMEYVQGSAIIGTMLAPCSVDGKRLTISLNRNNYKERIRFCVVPTKGGTMMPSAYVAFSLDDEVVQPIGSAAVTAKDMSISVPNTVAKPEVTVSGVAVPYSHVTVYDGTTLIGQVAAKADGNWMVKGEFIEPYNLSTHSVYANVVTPQEISMNTEVVNVLYDKNAIEVKTVTMINTAHPAGNLNLCEYKTVFDFQNPSQESPVYWYWPSYPDFTFIVDFTNNDTTMISDVKLQVLLSNGEKKKLPVEYDKLKDKWIVSHKFLSSSLPINVGVSYFAQNRTFDDVSIIADVMRKQIGDSIKGKIYPIENGYSLIFSDYTNDTFMYGLYGMIPMSQQHNIMDVLDSLSFHQDELSYMEYAYYYNSQSNAICINKNDSIEYYIFFPSECKVDFDYCIEHLQNSNSSRRKAYSMYDIPEPRNILEKARDAQISYWIEMAKRKIECADEENEIRLWDAVRRLRNSITYINATFFASYVSMIISASGIKDKGNPFVQSFGNGWNIGSMISTAQSFAPGVEGLNSNAQNAIQIIRNAPSCGNEPDNVVPNPNKSAQFVLDPSGYVYEAVTSNRLEGVTATIYQKVTTEDMYGDKHENIVKWDAESYSQRNPVKTDDNGLYSWDVPDGLWQVKFEKDGYETVYSDWLPVPPPQLDINVPMYQSVQPEVTGARGFESGVDFTFSKYMRPATFAEGSVTLSHDGKPVSGQLKMLNIEKEPLDGVEYVSHIKFVPDQSLNVGDEVTLTISREVKSYCGVTMEKDYTATLVIQPEINEIAVDSVVNVGYGSNSVIEVSVLPADAAKGKMLRLQNNTPSILVTDVTDFTLDADGKTKIPIAGALPGTGALHLSVDGSDISVEVKVNVVTISTKVAAPESSIPSGSTVEKGSLIILSCTTEGATIYYTLDGSCPCNEATRLVYKEPIIINETVTIKAMSVAPDMTESDVVEFTYIVDVVDSINDVTIDEVIKVYPLPARDKLNITVGGKIIKSVTLANINGSTIMSALKPVSHVTFDVTSLISGIYIINIVTEDKTYSRKIMKVE